MTNKCQEKCDIDALDALTLAAKIGLDIEFLNNEWVTVTAYPDKERAVFFEENYSPCPVKATIHAIERAAEFMEGRDKQ